MNPSPPTSRQLNMTSLQRGSHPEMPTVQMICDTLGQYHPSNDARVGELGGQCPANHTKGSTIINEPCKQRSDQKKRRPYASLELDELLVAISRQGSVDRILERLVSHLICTSHKDQTPMIVAAWHRHLEAEPWGAYLRPNDAVLSAANSTQSSPVTSESSICSLPTARAHFERYLSMVEWQRGKRLEQTGSSA